MKEHYRVIGIDIGSVAISLVETDSSGEILRRESRIHAGKVTENLKSLLESIGTNVPLRVAATGAVPPSFNADVKINPQVALIRGARELKPDLRTILYVGGEKFGVFSFDEDGEYRHARANSACAAGTGSFLDQQAERLGLDSSAELARIAEENEGESPPIATRCAVFAKTDLIHAQQEGWSRAAICDALCLGLARNIADALFKEAPRGPVLFVGGVARNRRVARHLEDILRMPLIVDSATAPFVGALGAALELLDRIDLPANLCRFDDRPRHSSALYPPLILSLSEYPDFAGFDSYRYTPPEAVGTGEVEVDIYGELTGGCDVYLGIDVGSTSTKAVIIDPSRTVLAGFYTRTAGRPVDALKALLASIEDAAERRGTLLNVIGCGTTGSGRKLAGAILKADTVLDEITAHARAACEIDPAVDTIIEIGGQDAKFTTLKDGRVSSSIMNNVCAAGTGSFLEEQGQKLGIGISEYASITEGVSAPEASDRCTVFMQRDLNHLLAEGWTRRQVLASALHAVRENYLQKVAVESRIGEKIFFQGATAKIRTLVAAFEQRLNKPIIVSPWCHLTGALGAALELADRRVLSSSFRGIDLWRQEIPVTTEVCELCANRCKLTIARVGGEPAVYGFLCGRDYETEHYVPSGQRVFHALAGRRFAEKIPEQPPVQIDRSFTLGLPTALYMREDLVFWRQFFRELGIQTKSGDDEGDASPEGRRRAGADFCAPIIELHGQVHLLAQEVDYLFLPLYMETTRDKQDPRKYCYYSQFAPALIAQQLPEGKVLSPVIRSCSYPFKAQGELYRALRETGRGYPFWKIGLAWERATAAKQRCEAALRERFRAARAEARADEVQVVLVGRPYTVLSPQMNKGIPDILAKQGVSAFFQDMVPNDEKDAAAVAPLNHEVHWHYASRMLEVAATVARTPGLYPVLISSFKCSPDSYLRSYFRRLMETAGKPYLILELDEHGSSVGYETRIEAALRSFRNHRTLESAAATGAIDYSPLYPDLSSGFRGKTLLLPNWDPFTIPLIAANLRSEGLDVRILQETDETIRRSLKRNDGQCIPMNAVAESAVDYVRRHKLDPDRTVLWMMRSDLACNIPLFPYHIRTLFRSYGEDVAALQLFVGDISFGDVSLGAAVNTYFASFLADS